MNGRQAFHCIQGLSPISLAAGRGPALELATVCQIEVRQKVSSIELGRLTQVIQAGITMPQIIVGVPIYRLKVLLEVRQVALVCGRGIDLDGLLIAKDKGDATSPIARRIYPGALFSSCLVYWVTGQSRKLRYQAIWLIVY
jgi:hypothetical protein